MINVAIIETIRAHQALAGFTGTTIVVAFILISGRRREIAMAKSGENRRAVDKG